MCPGQQLGYVLVLFSAYVKRLYTLLLSGMTVSSGLLLSPRVPVKPKAKEESARQ